MKTLAILLSLAGGAASWYLVPLKAWAEMNQGLIAFLGFLAAALIQVIPVTANFLQSERLMPSEAKNLTSQLAVQQRYWLGLLAATILGIIIVIIDSLSLERLKLTTEALGVIDLAKPLSALTGFLLSFILIKMLGIFTGVLSLQALRNSLVVAAAERYAKEKNEQEASDASKVRDPRPLNVPADYGSAVQTPNSPKPAARPI